MKHLGISARIYWTVAYGPNLQGTVKGGERVAGTENKYFIVLLTKSLRKWNRKNNSIIFKVLQFLFIVKWNEKKLLQK